jgi:D-3-phosphoglycerate dehydrogenase
MNNSKKKVYIGIAVSSFSKKISKYFKEKYPNINFVYNNFQRKMSKNEIIIKFQKCSIIIAGTEIYDEEVLTKLNHLKIISRVGVGIDNIDLKFINKKKIRLITNNSLLDQSVVELILSFIFHSVRPFIEMSNNLKNGVWSRNFGNLLSKKSIGIVGFGRIGKKLNNILNIIGSKTYVNDININLLKKYKIKNNSINHIYKSCDIIILCLSKSHENFLIDQKAMNFMKNNVTIINASRGSFINESHLLMFLKKNKLSRAYLDVFQNEPYSGPLTKLHNVYMTPHIGSYSVESRNRLEYESVKKSLEVLKISPI